MYHRSKIYLFLSLLLVLSFFSVVVVAQEEAVATAPSLTEGGAQANEEAAAAVSNEDTRVEDEVCNNPGNCSHIPLISVEELAKYDGQGEGDKIYLAILGDVYDVSKGPEYYGKGRGYSVFAGKDGAVPFITGKFNDEEAQKSTDVLSDSELHGLTSWIEFYRDEKRYPFVGRVVGLYYDAEGKETEELQKVKARLASYTPPKPKPRKRRKPKEAAKRQEAPKENIANEQRAADKGDKLKWGFDL